MRAFKISYEMNEEQNSNALHEFVHHHKLIGKYGGVRFAAKITIETAHNRFETQEMEVMVSLTDYTSMGKLTLIENELDPELFPTDFDVQYQIFNHVHEVYLHITGTHRTKTLIGKYSVVIVPLRRTLGS